MQECLFRKRKKEEKHRAITQQWANKSRLILFKRCVRLCIEIKLYSGASQPVVQQWPDAYEVWNNQWSPCFHLHSGAAHITSQNVRWVLKPEQTEKHTPNRQTKTAKEEERNKRISVWNNKKCSFISLVCSSGRSKIVLTCGLYWYCWNHIIFSVCCCCSVPLFPFRLIAFVATPSISFAFFNCDCYFHAVSLTGCFSFAA